MSNLALTKMCLSKIRQDLLTGWRKINDTVEPRYNELLYNEVLDITNDFLCSSNSKTYGKQTWYKETSLWKTNFASPLALYYIEVHYMPYIYHLRVVMEAYQSPLSHLPVCNI